jgi:hypothetical protein
MPEDSRGHDGSAFLDHSVYVQPGMVTLTFIGRRKASRRMLSRSGNVLTGCLLPPDLESLKPDRPALAPVFRSRRTARRFACCKPAIPGVIERKGMR